MKTTRQQINDLIIKLLAEEEFKATSKDTLIMGNSPTIVYSELLETAFVSFKVTPPQELQEKIKAELKRGEGELLDIQIKELEQKKLNLKK